jgi:DNA replication protein DnaC
MLRTDKSQFVQLTEGTLTRSRIPRRFWNTTISKVSQSVKPLVQDYIDHLSKRTTNGVGLYVHGDLNLGKTALVCHIAKHVMRRGGSVLFMQAHDVPMYLFSDKHDDDGDTTRYRIAHCDFMILDDLGAEHFDPKGAAGAELEWVIRQRYNEQRSLVITTNLSMAQLKERYTAALCSIIRRTTQNLYVEK